MRRLRRLVVLLCLVVAALVATGGPAAQASSSQTTILEANIPLLLNPEGTLMQARSLGISAVRVTVNWQAIAPNGNSFHQPKFDQTNPAAYPSQGWSQYDTLVRDAASLHMTVDFDLGPGAPLWATGPGMPKVKGYPFNQWEPNAADFQQFAKAIGTRYSGKFDSRTNKIEPNNKDDLPRVSFWSVWNEPDYGPSLAPQALPGHRGVEFSPREYRALANGAWLGLRASGHTVGADTFLIGELAPRSQLTLPNQFANFNGMTPVLFMQNLYCEDSHYRPWTGTDATLRGCPATAAARHQFVARNPALFHNSGISDHPYDEWFAPNVEQNVPAMPGYGQEISQYASLATIGNLEHALDLVGDAWGVHAQPPIWNTEYGYITSPPHNQKLEYDHHPWPSAQRAALYDNWAEYISYKSARLRSFDQYLIRDAVGATPANDYGSFASGLINFNGSIKADYGPFRMPLYMPHQSLGSPFGQLEVWGAARPATFARIDKPAQPETVTLQFQPQGVSAWATLETVPVNAQGYYDIHAAFPSSGNVRAMYSVPDDSQLSIGNTRIYSREIQITVH